MKLRCVFADCPHPHKARGMCQRHLTATKDMKDKPPGFVVGFGTPWKLLRADNEMLRRRVAELQERYEPATG